MSICFYFRAKNETLFFSSQGKRITNLQRGQASNTGPIEHHAVEMDLDGVGRSVAERRAADKTKVLVNEAARVRDLDRHDRCSHAQQEEQRKGYRKKHRKRKRTSRSDPRKKPLLPKKPRIFQNIPEGLNDPERLGLKDGDQDGETASSDETTAMSEDDDEGGVTSETGGTTTPCGGGKRLADSVSTSPCSGR